MKDLQMKMLFACMAAGVEEKGVATLVLGKKLRTAIYFFLLMHVFFISSLPQAI